MRIRPSEEQDLPALVELYNHYVRTTPITFVGTFREAGLEFDRYWDVGWFENDVAARA